MDRNSSGSFTLGKATTSFLNFNTAVGWPNARFIHLSVSWSNGLNTWGIAK